MNNKELVKQMVKLQVLTIRYVSRHTNLICKYRNDAERILTKNKLTCTYLQGVENLKENMMKYCKNNSYLMQSVLELQEKILNSDIKDLRFGYNPQKRFTTEESELNDYKERCFLYMITEDVNIYDAVEILGLNYKTILNAIQEEKLLNTYKNKHTWHVHLPECRALWDIPNADEKALYKDWIY